MGRDPRFMNLLREQAREASDSNEIGHTSFGGIVVTYHPVSQRYKWWLNGEATNKKTVLEWLMETTSGRSKSTADGQAG